MNEQYLQPIIVLALVAPWFTLLADVYIVQDVEHPLP
jgi:hypothetical protein